MDTEMGKQQAKLSAELLNASDSRACSLMESLYRTASRPTVQNWDETYSDVVDRLRRLGLFGRKGHFGEFAARYGLGPAQVRSMNDAQIREHCAVMDTRAREDGSAADREFFAVKLPPKKFVLFDLFSRG